MTSCSSSSCAPGAACRWTTAGISAGLILAACTSEPPLNGAEGAGPDDRLSVVTAFYPLHFATEQVGGDLVEVTDLTPAGADPHDLELSPVDVALMEQADAVVYLGGFQPAVDNAVEQIAGPIHLDLAEVVDLRDTSETVRAAPDAEGEAPHHDDGAHHVDHDDDAHLHDDDAHLHDDEHHEDEAHLHDDEAHHDEDDDEHHEHDHGPLDPHFWLDPDLMATAAGAIAETLTEADPQNAEAFGEGEAGLRADLEQIDDQYRAELQGCTDEVMLVSHLAFGYLAQRYDLTQVGLAGLDPHVEPSPAHLADIRRVVEAEDVQTIFLEPLASPRVTEALADELDLQVLALDSVENRTDEQADYLDVLQANLEALSTGLDCT